jgi:hypothetical protein
MVTTDSECTICYCYFSPIYICIMLIIIIIKASLVYIYIVCILFKSIQLLGLSFSPLFVPRSRSCCCCCDPSLAASGLKRRMAFVGVLT